MRCPLCEAPASDLFAADKWREYYHCLHCFLVFVPPRYFLSPEAEKAEYDLHQNGPGDLRYRRFLSRLFDPLNCRLRPGSRGLDFGCGPGPTLSVMFQEAGHSVSLFDPFYAPEPSALEERYDFITATEVVEHLHSPGPDLDRLWGCLKPGGVLGVMTQQVQSREAFQRWRYKNDLTHVCFFSPSTFAWLAAKWRCDVSAIGKDVVIFEKAG